MSGAMSADAYKQMYLETKTYHPTSTSLRLPFLKPSNFVDPTSDWKASSFKLRVGNEKNAWNGDSSTLQTVSLLDFLAAPSKHIGLGLSSPSADTQTIEDLRKYADGRDEEVLVAGQACILPVPTDSFHVSCMPYGRRTLVLVSTPQGTSAHLVDGYTPTQLLYNHAGFEAPWRAELLKAERARKGKDLDAPMDADERARNAIVIIQVPLEMKKTNYNDGYCGYALPPSSGSPFAHVVYKGSSNGSSKGFTPAFAKGSSKGSSKGSTSTWAGWPSWPFAAPAAAAPSAASATIHLDSCAGPMYMGPQPAAAGCASVAKPTNYEKKEDSDEEEPCGAGGLFGDDDDWNTGMNSVSAAPKKHEEEHEEEACGAGGLFGDDSNDDCNQGAAPVAASVAAPSVISSMDMDMERRLIETASVSRSFGFGHVVVSTARPTTKAFTGGFSKAGQALVRDRTLPVRVTYQNYSGTDSLSDDIPDAFMKLQADMVFGAYRRAAANGAGHGSLVIDATSRELRSTAPDALHVAAAATSSTEGWAPMPWDAVPLAANLSSI